MNTAYCILLHPPASSCILLHPPASCLLCLYELSCTPLTRSFYTHAAVHVPVWHYIGGTVCIHRRKRRTTWPGEPPMLPTLTAAPRQPVIATYWGQNLPVMQRTVQESVYSQRFVRQACGQESLSGGSHRCSGTSNGCTASISCGTTTRQRTSLHLPLLRSLLFSFC